MHVSSSYADECRKRRKLYISFVMRIASMTCHSLKFSIPDDRPFDKQESWFQSFVGAIILPVCEKGILGRFWFTQYGGVGAGKHALFRFETDDYTASLTAIKSQLSGH